MARARNAVKPPSKALPFGNPKHSKKLCPRCLSHTEKMYTIGKHIRSCTSTKWQVPAAVAPAALGEGAGRGLGIGQEGQQVVPVLAVPGQEGAGRGRGGGLVGARRGHGRGHEGQQLVPVLGEAFEDDFVRGRFMGRGGACRGRSVGQGGAGRGLGMGQGGAGLGRGGQEGAGGGRAMGAGPDAGVGHLVGHAVAPIGYVIEGLGRGRARSHPLPAGPVDAFAIWRGFRARGLAPMGHGHR